MTYFELVWSEFITLAQGPDLWVALGVSFFVVWLIAHLVGKAQLSAGKEPVAAAKSAVFIASPVTVAGLVAVLFVLSGLGAGYLLLGAIVLVLPMILATLLGRPVEVE